MVGAACALVSLVFLAHRLRQSVHELPPIAWDFAAVAVLTAAVVYCAATVVTSAFAWSLALRGAGTRISLRAAGIIVGKSQIAKYLPGNVFQYAGRATLAYQRGIPVGVTLIAAGAESLLTVLAAGVIGVVGLCWEGPDTWRLLGLAGAHLDGNRAALAVALLAGGGAALVLPAARAYARRTLASLPVRSVAALVAVLVAEFALFGVLISLVLGTVCGVRSEVAWYRFAWGFALAWIGGFVVPGAPAGLGVREAILVWLYGGRIGQGAVLVLALVLRVVTSLGDLLAFLVACRLDRGTSPPEVVRAG